MAFATTKHLKLRACRESDKDSYLAQENDQRVTRTASPVFVVPKGDSSWKEVQEKFFSTSLLVVIVEVKREYAGLRKWDEGEIRKEGDEKKQEDWDKELYAGYAALNFKMPKNRDARFGVTLIPQWWGNGFATEITEWILQHGFEQLNLHRISLGVFEGNAAAKRVYDKCGFVQEGLTRKAFWINGRWIDEILMGILDEDYWARKNRLAGKA
ncbi:acyl-CoA N-acyltransferase [Calocera viscosa TUFC12733]|uniref:Acyl-CoA N-acyltransferase n=1 Tax=Calocera viscosa (strain TUFC12733) TaxID=1330018 RepID=A0A167KGR7_CALVF|nr:acyl-CoA N-acyltransferase [Calocera viscosa TUFC12733]